MSKLKTIRERLNLTQEELADQSGISVRTIQRIESGSEPKGYTLKSLANTLGVKAHELLNKTEDYNKNDTTLIKLINLSSLPFTIIPPANIIMPLIIMFIKKQYDPMAKQIISIQILWTIFAVIIFMLGSFMKNWFSLGSKFILVVMILLVLSNVLIIIKNSAEIDKKNELFFRTSFSLV